MATYVISDIHGQYNMFIELLDKIDLKDTDTLYILGDVLIVVQLSRQKSKLFIMN